MTLMLPKIFSLNCFQKIADLVPMLIICIYYIYDECYNYSERDLIDEEDLYDCVTFEENEEEGIYGSLIGLKREPSVVEPTVKVYDLLNLLTRCAVFSFCKS